MPTDTLPTTFSGIRQMASLTGLSYPYLRSLKHAGCPAFNKDGTVKLLPFLEWLATNHGGKKVSQSVDYLVERAEKERAVRRIKEAEADELERKLIPTSEVQAALNLVLSMVRQQFLGALALAPHVNPADPEHARAILSDFTFLPVSAIVSPFPMTGDCETKTKN